MTDAAIPGSATKVSTRWFYAWMAMTCLAVAVLGFLPTYFVPLAQGKFPGEPIVHIHGLILFSWVTLFCTQTWLVAKGKVLAHRTWGMLGIAIVASMVFIVMSIVSLRIVQASSPGIPADFTQNVRAFEWISVSALLFFVPVFVLAIVNVKKPETHKRLMLLGTISLLPAPIARWFLTFLAPPPDPNAVPILLPNGHPAPAVPPIEVTIMPGLVADVLLVVAIIYDWRTRGKVHPVYIIGGIILLALELSAPIVAHSDLWQGIATAIGHLAG